MFSRKNTGGLEFSSSRVKINNMFSYEFGTTPMKFVRHLVIKKAISLLAYSNLTLNQIAEMLNFPDQHTFSRSFKRETGLRQAFTEIKTLSLETEFRR